MKIKNVCIKSEDVGPQTDQAKQTLAWYKEAKFGMFLHWGLYSINAWEEWARYKRSIPDEEYRSLVGEFNPVDFNADTWVDLAKKSGCKWITITAKHHDGFALYPSAYGDFDISNTPFKRNPLKELADACKKAGIKLAFYYSHMQDWDHPASPYLHAKRKELEAKGLDDYFENKACPQLKELLTNFGDIVIIWFDTPQLASPEEARRFRTLIQETSPATIMNTRLGQSHGDFYVLGDNTISSNPFFEPWETPMTSVKKSWAYTTPPYNIKSLKEVVYDLVSVVSRGGNYLLNIGPQPDGNLPEAEVALFTEVGEWIAVYGDSIYKTEMSPFIDEPEIFCTKKGSRLFFHLLDAPDKNAYHVNNLQSTVQTVYLLADKTKAPLSFTQNDETVTITLPVEAISPINTVLVVELEEEAEVSHHLPRNNSSDEIIIQEDDFWSPRVKKVDARWEVTRWNYSDLFASIHVTRPGTYAITIDQSAESHGGEPYLLRINNQLFTNESLETGDRAKMITVEAGMCEFKEAGNYTLRISPSIVDQFIPGSKEHFFWISQIKFIRQP